ncbi:MAG: two pore domain potassium channel family protein, partial [Colwellia sp.]|nr:two pore domain potassium channel family protein [Colwellia sp.]
ISHLSPISRFLVYFEAIVGQFYMAILVASLVGSHMSNFGANHNTPTIMHTNTHKNNNAKDRR